MKYILIALMFLIPSVAQACIIAPELATKEKIKTVPEGYFGFHVKLLSIKGMDGSKRPDLKSLPHDVRRQ